MTNRTVAACCECTPVRETRWGKEDDRSVSEAVVEGVAAAEGVTPMEIPPLYDTVDPDALDQLFTGQTRTSTPTKLVQFTYAGWNVFVRGDGMIRVCDPERATEQAPAFEKPLAEG